MVVEIITLKVKTGEEKRFETNFIVAARGVNTIQGYLGHNLSRCTETPSKYTLQIHWEISETPDEKFRESEEYDALKKMLHPYYTEPPQREHYITVFEYFK